MSTWTYILTTDIGKVRLLIGDTDIVPTTDAQFSDEEITAFLTLADSSIYLAAAMALEAWAAALTASMESEKIGDYAFSRKSAANKLALAERYRKSESDTPAVGWAEWDFNATGGPEFSEV